MSSTVQTTPAAPGRIPELDGVRGIAVLLVLVYHYLFVPLFAAPLGRLQHAALQAFLLTWSGVDLFFVLSGFLIGGILLDQRESSGYFKAFFARRAFRIVPLYLLCLALFAALSFLLRPLDRNPGFAWTFSGPMPAWSYLTFLQNFLMRSRDDMGAHALSVTWTLGVEEQFYLLLPFVVRWTPRRLQPAVFTLLFAIGPLLRVAMRQRGETPAFVILPCHIDSLITGVLCAWALRQPGIRRALEKRRPLLYATLGGLALWTVYSGYRPDPFTAFSIYPWRYTWMAAMYACLVLLAVLESGRPAGPIARVTRNPALRRLGILAYGLYMFHQLVGGMTFALLAGRAPRLESWSDLGLTLVAFGATLLLAGASWRWFESPLLARGHAVRYGGALDGAQAG